MSTPKVLLSNDTYKITFIRENKEVTIVFYQRDFLIMRTDDVDADEIDIDDEGYYYYIFGMQSCESEHRAVPLQPSEATTIVEQIFKVTGVHVCDY